MGVRTPWWNRVRDPLYALLGAAIVVPQILTGEWNPVACTFASWLLFGSVGMAFSDLVGGGRRADSGTPPGPTPSGSPRRRRSGPPGPSEEGDRDDETA
jgi:hypothetical protein